LFIVPVIIIVLILAFLKGFTHNYPGRDVDVQEEVEIGGMRQWIMANGKREDLPVLLWLHGGPGAAQMPVARYFNSNLEEEFIVVHWDQRGAGKSNPKDFDESTMTVEQFIQDTHELTQYVKERFDKEKIYLLGHSWGSQIGIVTASRYPEDYIAYIGVAQLANSDHGHVIAHEELERRIKEKGNNKDLETLSMLDGPPYRNHSEFVSFAKLLDKYNMHMDVKMSKLVMAGLGSGVYSITDFRQWFAGASRGSGPMWAETQGWDLMESVPHIDVPAFFIIGEHDYNTPAVLMDPVMKELEAPRGKELIVFKNAAHTPFFADPERFFMEMKRIKSLCQESVPPAPPDQG
jgi:pimeloyl-ACP methyl ester carboxylesterase